MCMYMLLIIRFVGKQRAGQFSPVLVTVLIYIGALTLKEDENSSCHGTVQSKHNSASWLLYMRLFRLFKIL